MKQDELESFLSEIINSKVQSTFTNVVSNQYEFIPHLSIYSKITSNGYFIYKTRNAINDYYLLIFNISTYECVSFKKIPLQNQGQRIKKCIFNYNMNNYSGKSKNIHCLLLLTENNLLFNYDLVNQNIFQINLYLPYKSDIIKICFSSFENIIGVLYSNNSFLLFNININKEILRLNLSDSNNQVVDFNFFPYLKSYALFSVLFLYENGQFSTITPYFPDNTYVDSTIISVLEEINNLYCYSIEKTLNDSLLTKMRNCIGTKGIIHLNDYLLNWNSNLQYKIIHPINNVQNNESEKIKKYKCFYFCESTSSPFVLIRVANNTNLIDVIVLCGEILPYREMKISFNKKNISENTQENDLMFFVIESLVIDESNFLNKEINAFNLNNNSIVLMLNGKHIYTLTIPYLKKLNKLLCESENESIYLNRLVSDFQKVLHCNNNNDEIQIIPFLLFDNNIIVLDYSNFNGKKKEPFSLNEINVKLFSLVGNENNIVFQKQRTIHIANNSLLHQEIDFFQKEVNNKLKSFPFENKLTLNKLSLDDNANLSFAESESENSDITPKDLIEIQNMYKSIKNRIKIILQFQKKFDNLAKALISDTNNCVKNVSDISNLEKEIVNKNSLIQNKIDTIKKNIITLQQNEQSINSFNQINVINNLYNNVLQIKKKVGLMFNIANCNFNIHSNNEKTEDFLPKEINSSLKKLNSLSTYSALSKNIKDLMAQLSQDDK